MEAIDTATVWLPELPSGYPEAKAMALDVLYPHVHEHGKMAGKQRPRTIHKQYVVHINCS